MRRGRCAGRGTFLALLLLLALSARGDEALDAQIRRLEERARDRPQDFVAFSILGQLRIRQAQEIGDLALYSKAEAAYRSALREFEAHAPALLGLGRVRMALHRFAEAAELAQGVLKNNGTNADAKLLLFDAELARGNEAAALAAMAALEDSPPVFARRSELERLHGKNDEAMRLALRAAEEAEARGESPQNIASYRTRLGELHFRRGELAAADHQYGVAKAAWPESYAVAEHIAELYGAQERFDEANALYRELLDRSHRPDLAQALGDLSQYRRAPAEAKQWYDQALSGYRNSVERGEVHFIHHLAGFHADVTQNGAEAVKWARKDLEMRQTAATREALAWALFRSGDFTAARREIDEALAGGVRDAHIWYHAGLIYSAAGDGQRGQQFLRETAMLNPAYNKFHVHR